MDKKLIKNYIYNILYQLVKIILPLIVLPYTYAHITPERLGIADYAGTILNWFILVGILGVNTYGNREIAKVRDDKKLLNKTFFEIFYMQLTNMLVAGLCYYIFVATTVTQYEFIFKLTGVTMLATMFDITWFYYGVEDFRKASLRNIFVKILGVSMIFMFCKTPDDLWKFIVINAGSELVGQAIMFAQLHQYITFEKVSLKDAYKHHFKATFELFVPTIAISVYTLLDQTMIGKLYSPTHLEYYKTSMGFIKMFLYFITSIGAVMLPRVTNVFHTDVEGSEKAERLINSTMKISLLLALPMCFGMMAISSNFIGWYLAKQPSAVPIIATLVTIGSPIIIFISMSNVTGIQYMVPVGMYHQYTASVIIGACINFAINIVLIPKHGAYGAIIGSIVAEFTVTAVQLYCIRKKAKINFKDRSYLIYVVSSLIMMFIVRYVGNHMQAGKMNTIVSVLVGMVVYALCLAVTKEHLFVRVTSAIRRRGKHAEN